MPASKGYQPIYFKAVEGTYFEGVNIPEAEAVVDILMNKIVPFENGEMPSVGVATTNITQRNLVWDKISQRRYENPGFSKKNGQIV